jgi:hypothetical protein
MNRSKARTYDQLSARYPTSVPLVAVIKGVPGIRILTAVRRARGWRMRATTDAMEPPVIEAAIHPPRITMVP